MKSKYKIENFVGKKFNNWEVLDFSHLDSKQVQYWICKCKCDRTQPVRTTFLFTGKSKNCRFCRNQANFKNDSKYWLGGKFISSTIFTRYKLSASHRNIEFNLTIDDLENQWLVQDGKCVYTNSILTLPERNRDIDFNASIDRIDSSKGYTPENIQWVIKEVNRMKMNLKEERFLELCNIITKNKK